LTSGLENAKTARGSSLLLRASLLLEMPKKETAMDRRLVTVSKFLAKLLRHAPEALGLTLQPGGWVAVDDLLAASDRAGFPISYDELIECVETNDKKRFSFDDTGDLIRANSGAQCRSRPSTRRKRATGYLIPRHRRALSGVDHGRGLEEGQTPPRPSFQGHGDGSQGGFASG
jgi:hypothetical protein